MATKKKLRVFEAFAGIGAQASALDRLNIDYEIVGISDWFIDAIECYAAIHCENVEVDVPQDIKEIADYDNSVWDHEDKCYIFTSFSLMEFKNATGQVTAEIQIRLDDNSKPILENVKLMAPHGVVLSVDEGNLQFTDLSFDIADAREEMMDALEEYYRH